VTRRIIKAFVPKAFAFHFANPLTPLVRPLIAQHTFPLQMIQIVRGQLKSLETVGQILDFLGFSIKMVFVEKNSTTNHDLLLLNEIFQLMPASWESDPVKVSLVSLHVCVMSPQAFPFSALLESEKRGCTLRAAVV
jgi:hypothetical protein